MNLRQQHNVALVAGATGIVGQQLIRALNAARWQVIGLTRQPACTAPGFTALTVNLGDPFGTNLHF